MNKRVSTIVLIVLILVLAGYIVIDLTLKNVKSQSGGQQISTESPGPADKWGIARVFEPGKGQLNAVGVLQNGDIVLGGESFIVCYDSLLNQKWEEKTEMPVAAISSSGKSIYAAVQGKVVVFGIDGEKTDEWGPFEENSTITSVASDEEFVAVADATNKVVFVLDKKGVVKYLIGKSEDPFVIPSLYFDVALDKGNILYVANTGNRRIEKRSIDGKLLGYFGKPGTDPDSFCGCCNPSHFVIIPGGFITSEKGINRIKILTEKGEFSEFVSSINKFVPPLPLDIASMNGKVIYGANPADSKLYIFKPKS